MICILIRIVQRGVLWRAHQEKRTARCGPSLRATCGTDQAPLPPMVPPLHRYKALLFDMNDTFMFGGDRLGPG